MWHYSDSQRFRHTVQPNSALAQSAYDLLLGMRSVAVTLLFLDLATPEHPVAEIPGFVEQVTTTCVTIGLSAPLPRLDPRTRFGVEIMAGPGILRFQVTAHRPPAEGDAKLQLCLPRQIESVQRRKFSRVTYAGPVAFSPSADPAAPEYSQGGIGQGLDLSAGGIRFATQEPLRYGQLAYVSFNTPDGAGYRCLPGRVVRVQAHDRRYTVAVRFTDLGDTVEGQLAQSVFRMQIRTIPGK